MGISIYLVIMLQHQRLDKGGKFHIEIEEINDETQDEESSKNNQNYQ